ncbi:hypothetical protein [Arthrobacter mobilis]|uniref:Uncharacterized protein n=1 Tax=Arthrobacter mobilis TaxID=2724944 RepID=A0A7X6HA55_9MICC|nr:hypothetical protein [Arthrobacter mobilis]NKX53306.1 hypothetical protein [Arthrobacter mobilis]
MANTAAVMTGLNAIAFQDRRRPEPCPGEAVIEAQAVGVRGSDVANCRYGKTGPFVVDGGCQRAALGPGDDVLLENTCTEPKSPKAMLHPQQA